jgi:hypothetical protein
MRNDKNEDDLPNVSVSKQREFASFSLPVTKETNVTSSFTANVFSWKSRASRRHIERPSSR